MIKLDENHRLDSDRYQFIIQKRTVVVKKEAKHLGEEFWDNVAYLPKIEDVLRYMIHKEIKENMDDVGKIVLAVQNLENKFEDLLKARKL